MPLKEIFLDRPSMLNNIFANNIVKSTEKAEKSFGVKIIARDCSVKLESDNNDALMAAYDSILELIKIHESGYSIHEKDFDMIIGFNTSQTSFKVKDLFLNSIKVGPNINPIIPRTPNQCKYIKAIKNHEIVFGLGPAGTGKTYLAMALAVSAYLSGEVSRIILTRPALEAGENLGFLPGSLEEKIKPYLRPLYDALYDMLNFGEVDKLIENNIIEVAPLAFMRGRTLNKSFIILDEAQNTTNEQMMMMLTRIGFDSKCVITGDPTQTDLPKTKKSGLLHARQALNPIKEISFIEFTSSDVVRNALIEKIINAYASYKTTAKHP